MRQNRRQFLHQFLSLAALPAFAAGAAGQTIPKELAPTPQCRDGDDTTIPQTEGPFFKPNSPMRHDLTADVPTAAQITLAGYVLDRHCRPIGNALVELWHADEMGRYDNRGNRCRGHQRADGQGRWWFTTIIPARYTGRTRHYHLKVQRPGGPGLTTQLYFPDEPGNSRDRLFDPRLLMDLRDAANGPVGRFDFVLG